MQTNVTQKGPNKQQHSQKNYAKIENRQSLV